MAAPNIGAAVLGFIGKVIGPVIEGAKWLFTILTVKKAVKTEERNEVLETTNEAQKKQLDIASRPPRLWDRLLGRMHDNDL